MVVAVVGIELIDTEWVRASFNGTDSVDLMLVHGIGAPVFLVERVCFAASPVFLEWSKNRRRSVSHDEHRSKSPLPILTDLSFRRCGHGPSGKPSQTGIAVNVLPSTIYIAQATYN